MEDILILGTVGRERVHSFGTMSAVVFGGTAYYATEAILRSGGMRPLLVSALGNDLSVAELRNQFSQPINTYGLQENANLPSFFWEARYDTSFEESTTIVLENRIVDDFKPDWIDLEGKFPNIRYCYLAAFDPQVQVDCSRHFNRAFIVSETLEYWIDRDRQGVLDLVANSNGLVVTEREFRALWNFDAPLFTPYERVSAIIERYGLDFLIITFADRGSQIFDSKGTYVVPALQCNTFDSTGAGNAFSGGIVGHLAQHEEYDPVRLYDAVALGTGLASLQVQEFSNRGLRSASSDEVEALWQKAKGSIQWYDPKV